VILENRRTIFKLVKEGIFGRRERPKRPGTYEEAVSPAVADHASTL
jgi:hypothetical protein